LPSLIAGVIAEVAVFDWINYISLSALITSTTYFIFGKPEASSLMGDFFETSIKGEISIVIVFLIAIIAVLVSINSLYKEEIN